MVTNFVSVSKLLDTLLPEGLVSLMPLICEDEGFETVPSIPIVVPSVKRTTEFCGKRYCVACASGSVNILLAVLNVDMHVPSDIEHTPLVQE